MESQLVIADIGRLFVVVFAFAVWTLWLELSLVHLKHNPQLRSLQIFSSVIKKRN